MSLQNKFFKFHDAILLGIKDVAYANARLKDESILKEIKARFKEDGFSVIDDFIQGSMATDTGIREKGQDFDIDRAIVIEASLAPENPITPKKRSWKYLKTVDLRMQKSKNLALRLITRLKIFILIFLYTADMKMDNTNSR